MPAAVAAAVAATAAAECRLLAASYFYLYTHRETPQRAFGRMRVLQKYEQTDPVNDGG